MKLNTTFEMEQITTSAMAAQPKQIEKVKPVVIGIYGISGCGKSHLIRGLKNALSVQDEDWYVALPVQACFAFLFEYPRNLG